MTATATDRPLWQRLLRRRLRFAGGLAAVLALLLGGAYLFAPQWLLRADIARQALAAHLDTHTVQVGDTRWSYYEGGQGPTLVLLHGFAADRNAWLPLATRLTAHFHLVIPDLPGWGDSTRLAGADYGVQAQAARLAGFMDALGLRGVVLVGHSLGGAVAGVYAAGHPDTVRELALIDSFGLAARVNAFDRRVLDGQNPFAFSDRAGLRRALSDAFEPPPRVPGRIADVLVARNVRDHAFLDRTLARLREPDEYLALQQRLGDLAMPVLGLWCRDDRIVDVSALDSLRNGLARAPAISTTVLAGCNHVPIVSKADEVARILTGFALSH